MKPRIGISSEFAPRESDPEKGRYQIEQEYADALLAAGGYPVAIPVLDPGRAAEYGEMFDGFVFTGGSDLPPSLYGEEPHPETKIMGSRRYTWDFALLRSALDRRKPVLGICLGIQELNVALGGSLVQHLETGTRHARDETGHAFHEVDIVEPGSRLHGILGTARLETNSSHHQAVGRLGEGLRVTARATDGTVEGIEPVADRGFVVGVQWHPERIADRPEHLALFQALVEAARR